ncbi:hypothetical protein LSS_22775 [Leptospira santarosai serovar Shermani str. LT 821]|uniref:Uncharacterized protein n=1 Tax=Leptospira santarosai serovar Shermani str. LT 821 TaxID=758847 RepID=A0A097ESZ7_9LEPT|nr:hypothetical protein LSS_22775 [Leptospira santarosai serovar Shermani str. LT 821]
MDLWNRSCIIQDLIFLKKYSYMFSINVSLIISFFLILIL